MVGAYVMTEHNCRGRRVADDSVGLAAYNMDSHNTQRYVDADGHARNEGDVEVGVAALPDQLPGDRAEGRRVHEPAGAGVPVGQPHRLRLDPHGAGVHGPRPVGRHGRRAGDRARLYACKRSTTPGFAIGSSRTNRFFSGGRRNDGFSARTVFADTTRRY